MTIVWIYFDTSKQVGDRNHLKVFESESAANEWLKDNDPEGVAFEYDVLGSPAEAQTKSPAGVAGLIANILQGR